MALNPKQKKRLKIGIIISSIATLLIATPIATFYALFYDSKAKDTFVPKEVNYQNILADSITYGMNKAKDENVISFTSSEKQINDLLKVFKGKSYEFARYVTNFEYNFETNEIYLDFQIPLFKTRATLKVETSFDEEKQNLLVKVNDIQLGRVKSIMGAAKKLTENKQAIKALIWLLETMNLYVNFDVETTTFIFPLEYITYNLYAIAFDDPSMLFAGLISQVAHDGHATASLEDKTLSVSFSELKHPNKYDIPEYNDVSWPIKDVMDKYITPMIKDGFFEKANDSEKLNLFRLFMLGYENYGEDDQKQFEKNYDFSKYGIEDIAKYESPVKERLDKKIIAGKKITQLIDDEIELNKDKFANDYAFNIVLTEEDFRNSLLTSPILFSGFIPSSLNGDTFHYGMIDNCYFNLKDNGFAIVSKFNIDENIITHSAFFNKKTYEKEGKDVSKQGDNNSLFEYEISETLFGDVEACNQADWSYGINLYNFLVYSNNFMSFVTNSEDGIRQTTKKDYVLTFDFANPINDSKLLSVLDDKGLTFNTALNFNESEMVLTFTLKG